MEKKYIKPVLNDIYAAVGAAYQLANWPKKKVTGADAYMAKCIRRDVQKGDISNLMAYFTALLNKVNDNL